MEILRGMGEAFLIGVNGACVAAGFTLAILAMLAVLGFIANIIGVLLGGGKNDEG